MNYLLLVTTLNAKSGLLPGILCYLDPGTGSIIIQAIIAAVVGIGVAVKLFWHRILKFLGIRKAGIKEEAGKTENENS